MSDSEISESLTDLSATKLELLCYFARLTLEHIHNRCLREHIDLQQVMLITQRAISVVPSIKRLATRC